MKNILQGKLTGNERGYAFFTPDGELNNDYFISHGDLRGANHGDTVLCEVSERVENDGKRTIARVLKIIERGIDRLVGTYFSCGKGGFVSPDDRRYFTDIFVPFGQGARAKSGDKVVCKILAYPKRKSPEGIIVSVLGRQFDKQAELKSILFTYKLPEKFPKAVIEESEALAPVNAVDIKGRVDLRNKTIFTIDGDDAKDFDDAVSIEQTADGKYILGVHIADVSHYVKFGGAIDKEALLRGTSVYFPEKVIPMLPERLSNDLCSLVEGEDRLTVSCVMTIDKTGKRESVDIFPSVIKSVKRATYSNVQKVIEGDGAAVKEYGAIAKDILLMKELADILIKAGERDGEIDLDVKESAISVDKSGEIIISQTEDIAARKLIEVFMVAANCSVAEYLCFSEQPCIYRIHEKPTDEKTDRFYAFLNALGLNFKRNKTVYPSDFLKILDSARNTPAFTVINRVMLRSMQKAKYSVNNAGHFGLSKTHYCHFTSPIRRYPDLTVHRILKDYIAGKSDLNEKFGVFLSLAADRSSETEKNAVEAERAVDEFYKMLYISGFVGEKFNAVVSGVTNFGVFAELENGIEGLIKIDTIKGRKFKLIEDAFILTDGKTSFRLGQRVKIKVVGVNYGTRKVEFEFCD